MKEFNNIIKFLFRKNKRSRLKNKLVKTFFSNNATLNLTKGKDIKVKELEKEIKDLFKKSFKSSDEIINSLESKGAIVIRAPKLDKLLQYIGEKEGFLFPLFGTKAFILSMGINILSEKKINIGFETPAMFVFQDKPYSVYLLIHQVYHWLAYLKDLPGYDDETIEMFKGVFADDYNMENIDNMTIDDVLALKEVIARDLEAINMAKEISRETTGSKNCLNRIKSGENLNL